MPLTIPTLDDRKYPQLRDEALARIPVHNPEWTNFGPSDPGVTLVELFAFLTENLLYRVNQIPERNRRKFLSLLGVPLQPASSAGGIVSFTNERGPLQTFTLTRDLEVLAGNVPFRTEQGLDVLPVEARVYFKREFPSDDAAVKDYYDQLYAAVRTEPQPPNLKLYETMLLETSSSGVDLSSGTVDRSLWIALLARAGDAPADNSAKKIEEMKQEVRKAIGGRVLSLGLVPSLSETTRHLAPGGPINPEGQSLLIYEMPRILNQGLLPDNRTQRKPQYQALQSSAAADVLARPGVVQLILPPKEELILWTNLQPLEAGTIDFPPALEDTKLNDRLITWVRVRATSGVKATILWAGINATFVRQRARAANEALPKGTGEPDQAMKLARAPVIADSVQITVSPLNGTPKAWKRIEDLMNAGPEVPLPDPRQPPGTPPPRELEPDVFTVDPESGTIRFGDGARGRRPPPEATVRADYDYGRGREGNVGKGAINTGAALRDGMKVSNPVPTWGGADAETVSEGEKQISRYLQHRDRLVSGMDFETITLRTPGVDIGRVDVIPAYSPELAGHEPGDAPGAVTLMLIPQNDPEQPDAPRPDRLFLDTICAHLNPRRLVTTEVFLRGPNYKPIWVSVGLSVVAGLSIAEVNAAVKKSLLQFLSPLPANRKELLDNQAAFLTTPQHADAQKGWPLRKAVVDRELMAVASRVPGVLSVNDVWLGDEAGTDKNSIPMTGLDLPRVMAVSVVSGEPLSVGELRGQPVDPTSGAASGVPAGPAAGPHFVPVPVIPKEC